MRSARVIAVVVASLLWVLGGATLGRAQTKPLPPGHPPTGSPGLVWTAPPGWTSQQPASPMRRAQYAIAGPGGPAECAVFYFGPGQGGDAESNVARWAGQFNHPDGGAGGALKKRELTVGDIRIVMVEVTGNYVGGMGARPSGPARPDYMLLGAIAAGPDANWFFRAMGPRKTLEPQRAAFERMIRSLKHAPSK